VFDRVLVSLVVLALFLERFEKDWWESGHPPIPDVFFVSSIVLLAARFALLTGQNRIDHRRVSKELALASFVALLGVLTVATSVLNDETHVAQATKTYVHVVALAAAAFLIGRTFSRGRLIEWALCTYFALAVLVSLVTITQAIDQNLVSFGFADSLGLRARTHAEIFVRPMATFSEPSYLGYSTLVGTFIGVGLVAPRHRRLGYIGVTACVVAFLLAVSFGAMAVATVLIGIVVVTRLSSGGLNWPRGAAIPAVTIGLLVCSTLLLVDPIRETIANRVESIVAGDDPSTQLRKQQNRGSIEIWRDWPLTGIGLGNTRFHLPEYIDVQYDPGTSAQFSAANAYLGLLGETGPLGALALLLLPLVLARRNPGAPEPAEVLTQLFMLITFLQFFIIGAFVLPPFWFWAGLRLAGQRRGAELRGWELEPR
jgi:hypothetical protein